MRALVFDGPGSISYRADLANPQLLDDRDAIVVLDGAGLCGSDLHPYLGREPARAGVIPGHEAVGSVVATGSGVVHIRPGDRVIIPFTASCGVCRPCMSGLSSRCDQAVLFGWGHPDRTEVAALQGMQAQSVRVPMADSTLVRIPDSVTIPQAILLADNLPTGWHAVRRSDVSRGETLVILGAGSVGLCAIAAAMQQGVERVVSIDPVESRRAAAARLGARSVAPDDPSLDHLDRAGSVIDAAGTAAAQRLALELCRPGATLALIAVQTEQAFGFSPVEAYDRNLTVRAGRAPVRSLLDELMPLVATGDLATPENVVFTHEGIPLEDGPDAYRRFADRSGGMIKAWFDPRR
jgi:alcohol dehydrogenase